MKINMNYKIILNIIIGLVVIWILVGSNLSYINKWNTSELVGYNIWSIIVILSVSYIVYRTSKLKK